MSCTRQVTYKFLPGDVRARSVRNIAEEKGKLDVFFLTSIEKDRAESDAIWHKGSAKFRNGKTKEEMIALLKKYINSKHPNENLEGLQINLGVFFWDTETKTWKEADADVGSNIAALAMW